MDLNYITSDLAAARDYHELNGGWLLNLDEKGYLVTDDLEIALQHRGNTHLLAMDDAGEWDETV